MPLQASLPAAAMPAMEDGGRKVAAESKMAKMGKSAQGCGVGHGADRCRHGIRGDAEEERDGRWQAAGQRQGQGGCVQAAVRQERQRERGAQAGSRYAWQQAKAKKVPHPPPPPPPPPQAGRKAIFQQSKPFLFQTQQRVCVCVVWGSHGRYKRQWW